MCVSIFLLTERNFRFDCCYFTTSPKEGALGGCGRFSFFFFSSPLAFLFDVGSNDSPDDRRDFSSYASQLPSGGGRREGGGVTCSPSFSPLDFSLSVSIFLLEIV